MQPRFKDEPECDVPVTSKRPMGADSPIVKELSLEGVWAAVSVEEGGEKLPEEIVKDLKFTFRAGKLRVQLLGKDIEGCYKVNLSKRPLALDITIYNPVKGIFVVRGNILTICVNDLTETRPTTFAAPAGSGHSLVILRRTNP
ncbi:MAG TPA: TIGR03067 domain-containing protein [Gemmataceae bacterium]|nr:TIGR03067 domain-containing protein [Gemmataceae bacterium]